MIALYLTLHTTCILISARLQLKDCLLSGSSDFIYPLLHWMLNRIPDLKKRYIFGA